VSTATEEIIRLCENLPPEKRAEVADFARFLLARIEEEPNETTAVAIREPVASLPKYPTVEDAWQSLKSDAKRRSKKPVSA
jgi:hypothetical protein